MIYDKEIAFLLLLSFAVVVMLVGYCVVHLTTSLNLECQNPTLLDEDFGWLRLPLRARLLIVTGGRFLMRIG